MKILAGTCQTKGADIKLRSVTKCSRSHNEPTWLSLSLLNHRESANLRPEDGLAIGRVLGRMNLEEGQKKKVKKNQKNTLAGLQRKSFVGMLVTATLARDSGKI